MHSHLICTMFLAWREYQIHFTLLINFVVQLEHPNESWGTVVPWYAENSLKAEFRSKSACMKFAGWPGLVILLETQVAFSYRISDIQYNLYSETTELFTTQSRLLTTLEKNALENTVGKEENAGNQHFLLFPQCFLLYQKEKLSF